MSGGVADDQKVKLVAKPGNPFPFSGLLAPLRSGLGSNNGGVVFPYTPTIQISHNANYGAFDITHGMYAPNYYVNTPTPTISLTAMFTANSVSEAKYMIAAIHFFKTCVKSDFGEQRRATAGTPPPILNFSSYGSVHAKNTPVIVTNFGYTLTEDVDYVTIEEDAMADGMTAEDQTIFDAGADFIEDFSPGSKISVPTQVLLSIELRVQYPPSSVRKEFNIQDFANGSLLKGYI